MESYQDLHLYYKRQQESVWYSLRDELEKFKEECGASMAELAEGLQVSRQLLYAFMDLPSNGLNKINRSSLLNLWALLTAEEEYPGKKLSSEHKKNRQRLKAGGPDQLLKATGFLPEIDKDESAIKVTDPQMKRIILRLQSQWLLDDALRAYIVDGILDRVLDQGRPEKEAYINPLEDKQKIVNWPQDFEIHKNPQYLKPEIIKQYKSAIENFIAAGKDQFVQSELFELYQSILEHHETNSLNTEEVKVLDCQFETLSSSSILDNTPYQDSMYDAESKIAFDPSLIRSKIEGSRALPAVTKVKIRVRFPNSDNQNKIESEWLDFQYISTATHVENMLVALQIGLCHNLKISGFFIRAVGRSDKSLARVAIALSEPKSNLKYQSSEKNYVEEVFQGWWVTPNTILGIIEAFIDAFKKWLVNKQKIDQVKSSCYYQACRELSKVNSTFYKVNSYVYEGYFESNPSPSKSEIKALIKKDIIDVSKKIERNKDVPPYNIELLKEHWKKVNIKERRSMLLLFNLSMYEGDLKTAKKIVDQNIHIKDLLKGMIGKEHRDFKRLLIFQANSSLMRYKLISGDEEFLVGKQWLFNSTFSPEKCEESIRNHVKSTKKMDFNSYFCAADLFSTLGIIEFYTGRNISSLERGIGYLLDAAHFSSRIGYKRCATQWLMYVVRCLCRINDSNSSKNIENILVKVESLLRKTHVVNNQQPHRLNKDKDWLNVVFHIGRGEYYMLVLNKIDVALEEFTIALGCAMEIQFIRIIPDCMYNLSRAYSKLIDADDQNLGNQAQHIYPASSFDALNDALNEEYRALLLGKLFGDNLSAKELASRYKYAAAAIWNKWAQDTGRKGHVFSQAIEEGTFLEPLQ